MAKYFTEEEFKCTHCGTLPPQGMDVELTRDGGVLDKIREAVGEPVYISGPYRCPTKNAMTSGAASNSYHMQGKAVDIFIESDRYSVYELRDIALACGADTACAYPDAGFVHIDMRGYFQKGWV